MNEFKFSCPWCRQHMMCDMSQRGTVMQCPTCFQQVCAPMAPSPDAKYILTGTKVQAKKTAAPSDGAAAGEAAGGKKIPFVPIIIGVIVLALAVGAAVYFLRGKSKTTPPGKVPATNTVSTVKTPPVANPPTPPTPPPPASDKNWNLNLDSLPTPKTPVVGRIHGQDFKADRAWFQSGSLGFRLGTQGTAETGFFINFGGAQAAALSGKTIEVSADTEKAAVVMLRWRDETGVQKKPFSSGYAMRLEFGAVANNQLPGSIYLCTPDAEKSYLLGTFRASVYGPPKPKPTPKK